LNWLIALVSFRRETQYPRMSVAATTTEEVRELLERWRAGDTRSRDRLFECLYDDISSAAAALLHGERHVSLSVGDLVHESMLRLIVLDRIDWQDRAHFMALTSRMMRRALIDHVRAKRRGKRQHLRVVLETNIPDVVNVELDDISDALDRLARFDPGRAEVVEMRYFGGMAIPDIAVVLGLSEATVKRRWQAARLWLYEALSPAAG
jgi:RNA polymerase sigma factor (TIGR02999 family)